MNGLTLVGAVLLGFAMPLGFEGFGSNNRILQVLSIPLLLLGLASIGIDYFDKETWVVKYILGID